MCPQAGQLLSPTNDVWDCAMVLERIRNKVWNQEPELTFKPSPSLPDLDAAYFPIVHSTCMWMWHASAMTHLGPLVHSPSLSQVAPTGITTSTTTSTRRQ